MKTTTKTLIATVLSVAGLSAFAQSYADYIGPNAALDAQVPATVSVNSRDAVKADLSAALANGSLDRFDVAGVKAPKAVPATLLAQVRSQADQLGSTGLTREAVRAQVLAAQRAGELDPTVNADVINARPAVHTPAASRTLAQSL